MRPCTSINAFPVCSDVHRSLKELSSQKWHSPVLQASRGIWYPLVIGGGIYCLQMPFPM